MSSGVRDERSEGGDRTRRARALRVWLEPEDITLTENLVEDAGSAAEPELPFPLVTTPRAAPAPAEETTSLPPVLRARRRARWRQAAVIAAALAIGALAAVTASHAASDAPAGASASRGR